MGIPQSSEVSSVEAEIKLKANDSIEQKRNRWLMSELQMFPEHGKVVPIPYDYVGADIRKKYPTGTMYKYRRNYPDWHMITPAYNINFSGMTKPELIARLIDPRSKNNIVHRVLRLWREEKVVTYTDIFAKISSVSTILFLTMTFAITIWQLMINAEMSYKIPSVSPDTTDLYERSLFAKVDQLNRVANSTLWKLIHLVLSGLPAFVIIWNAFKRSTIPVQGITIDNIGRGTVIRMNRKVMPINKTLKRAQTAVDVAHWRRSISNSR